MFEGRAIYFDTVSNLNDTSRNVGTILKNDLVFGTFLNANAANILHSRFDVCISRFVPFLGVA